MSPRASRKRISVATTSRCKVGTAMAAAPAVAGKRRRRQEREAGRSGALLCGSYMHPMSVVERCGAKPHPVPRVAPQTRLRASKCSSTVPDE